MKRIFHGFCLVLVVVSGFVFYFALQRAPVVKTIEVPGSQPSRFSGQNSPRASVAEQKVKTLKKKKCACCREKLVQNREYRLVKHGLGRCSPITDMKKA